MARDNYIKKYTEGNVCIVSERKSFEFLAEVVALTQRVCRKNNFEYSCYIDHVIECPKQYKSSFMAKAICPEGIELWLGCGSEDLKTLTAYFLNHALLSKEFSSGNPWVGTFDKKVVKHLKRKAWEMVNEQ